MFWNIQSPDLNHIEKLFNGMKSAQSGSVTHSVIDQEHFCKQQLNKIAKSSCAKLPKKSERCITSKRCFNKALL